MRDAASVGEFRRGWPVLLVATFGIGFGISPVPFNVMGHIAGPLQAEFGWSRGQVMGAISVLGLSVTVLAPFFGAAVDRFGVRRIGIAALIGFAASWAAVTLTTGNILVFYALWGLMAVLGGASIPVSWTRAVNAWFDRHKGLALAIALMGSGISALIINNAAPVLIAQYGWRAAVLASAALPVLVALPLAVFLLRDRPPARETGVGAPLPETGLELRAAVRQPRFAFMFLAFLLVALAFAGLHANYVPLLLDEGFSAAQAGGITGLIGISVIVGRLGAGFLLDRFWAPLVAFPLFVAPAIACLILAGGSIGLPLAMLTAILIGLAAGVESDLIAYLSARYFGLKNYGRIYGIMYMAFAIGSSTSPALYGVSYDLFGSYRVALLAAAGLFCLGALLLLLIGRYPQPADRQPT